MSLEYESGRLLGDLVHEMMRVALQDPNVLLPEETVSASSRENRQIYCGLREQLNAMSCSVRNEFGNSDELPFEDRYTDGYGNERECSFIEPIASMIYFYSIKFMENLTDTSQRKESLIVLLGEYTKIILKSLTSDRQVLKM